MSRSPSQLGGILLKGREVRISPGEKISVPAQNCTPFLPFLPSLSGEKECVLGFLLPIRCAKLLYAVKCETCAIAPGFMPKEVATSSAGFG